MRHLLSRLAQAVKRFVRVERRVRRLACPACGFDTDDFIEGYCAACYTDRQRALDEHNARYDWWESLTERERDLQIRNAYI